MGDENHIHTLGDYSKPSYEGYRNTIELPIENNVQDPSPHGRILLPDSLLNSFHQEDLTHHGIDRWLQIQIFYDHVYFPLKCEIDRAAGGKLRNKNTDESWEIIENLAFYDHEGWDEIKEFVKPVKAISTPQGVPKTPDQRLLELKDHINFLLKGSRPMPTSSSAHIPQAYVNVVHPNPHPRNQNEPPKLDTFAFRERTGPSPQPQELETTFEARV
ncbi:hypothetical protein Tco_1370976 [Tanacetum coccineum]